MSDDSASISTTAAAVDPVRQLLQENGSLTTEQRNERREALLKRQREAREKAQQLAQTARANASSGSGSTAPAPSVASTSSTTVTPSPATPVAAPAQATAIATAPVVDAPIRESMVQQAVSFLSSPNVQSAEESKKAQFLEKKGLTAKEIELARARVAGSASAPTVATAPQQPQQPYQPSSVSVSNNLAPPPVPPRAYAPMQGYVQPVYIQQQQQQVAADPNAFKRKLVIALLISGGVTVLASILVQKLIYPMIRGITGARQTLAFSQKELLSRLKEKLLGYKEYLSSLHLGSNRAPVKQIKDTKSTVEDEEADEATTTTTTTTTATATAAAAAAQVKATAATYQSTVKQLDMFSKKLEAHANNLNFEQLKATRATTQDLAEYITNETYSLTSSVAYPTARYYGYNTAGAAASGKGVADPTTPEAALKSEIRLLKGLLLNWRNFPVAKEAISMGLSTGAGGGVGVGRANGVSALPNLVQQQ
ncbi:hypothetical protein BGZ65_002921 [Modicella reniformis]|uniref:Peroxisomal membrane protein PEX14 n=1 Tax=Modicella reniformis TaxID=1440133 RepID=A0A9P6STX0_9FUNG|nr:hypothetical protein BGZ65_002921 [Modicella reniformis]